MKPIAQLGARASLLLGMLASPLTAVELYDMVERADDELDVEAIEDAVSGIVGFRGGSVRVTIQAILNGGTLEVLRLLERLEDAGVVARLGEPSYDQCLWWRIDPSAW